MSSNDITNPIRAVSFTIGRSDGVTDGVGLARKGIDPRRVQESTIQSVAADEAARQGLDAIAYAEGYGTGLVQAGDAIAPPPAAHPPGTGACALPVDGPCCDACAAEYSAVDPSDTDAEEPTV